jgi:Fe-S-cluster containining protein
MAEINRSEKNPIVFICEKCGECCRHIEQFIQIWPHQHNGICNFLQENVCSIYEARPDFCSFQRGYNKYCKNYMTETEYYAKTIYYCEQLRKEKK